jgi:hypothetical protein
VDPEPGPSAGLLRHPFQKKRQCAEKNMGSYPFLCPVKHRTEPDARAVCKPQPFTLKSLPPPDPLYPLMVDTPAFSPQHGCYPAVAVTPELTGQFDNTLHEPFLVLRHLADVLLGGTRLTQYPTRPSLRHSKLLTHMSDRPAEFSRAQKFPRTASLRMSLSNDRSATSFLSRPFSFSSSLSRLA